MDFLFSIWIIWTIVSLRLFILIRRIFINILIIWGIFEIRTILSVPLISSYYSATNVEGALKYFLIQIIRGIIFLVGLVNYNSLFYLLELAILLKLGAFPFFFWVPHIFSGINYFGIGIIRTLIKLPSLTVLSTLINRKTLIIMGGISVVIGSITGVLLRNSKLLLRYSRISHTGWLIIISGQFFDWWAYYFIYSLLVVATISWLRLNSIKRIYQMIMYVNWVFLIYRIRLFLSLAGIPPTIGFYLKLIVLSISRGIRFRLIMLLALSLTVSVYYYSIFFLNALLLRNKPRQKVRFRVSKLLFMSIIVLVAPLLF